jgi:hypothetical protein
MIPLLTLAWPPGKVAAKYAKWNFKSCYMQIHMCRNVDKILTDAIRCQFPTATTAHSITSWEEVSYSGSKRKYILDRKLGCFCP